MKAAGAPGSRRRAALAAGLAFLAGLAVTAAVTHALSLSAQGQSHARFDGAVRRLENDLVRRITQAGYGLGGLAASYSAHGKLTTGEFRDWVAARDLPVEFPGVRGFGLISRVERADLDAFVASRRRVDPAFEVTTSGHAPDLYIVSEIEPRAPNIVVWGYDLGQEALRRTGLERAVAIGGMTLTHRISIIQDDRKRAGWLLFLPIYRKGEDPRSAQGRKRALVGLLYAPIVAAEVLADVRDTFASQVDFRLYDGAVEEGALIFDSRNDSARGLATGVRGGWEGRRLRAVRNLEIGGRRLTLQLAGTADLEASAGDALPVKVALVGVLLSSLLGLAVWQLVVGRRRAEDLAAAMTRDLSRTTSQLRSSEAFLEQAQLIAHVGGWEVELETLAVRLSAQTLRLFDLPAGSAPSIAQFIGFFTPASQQEIRQATRQAVRDGTPWDLQLSLVSARGVQRWVRTVGRVEREGDRSVRLIGTLQDITARKHSEQALQASEALMRVVTDNLPGRVGYWNREQRCVFANRAFGETFGVTREAIIGRSLRSVLGDARYEEYRPDIEAALAGTMRVFEREEPFPGGSRRTMFVHYIPDVRDGEVHGFFVLALDVSELKEAREAAREASAAKGKFLANTSHELRTPMNAILGMLALLRQTPLGARQLDYVDKAEGAARSLLGVLNDILDFSKVEAGKLELDPRPFRLEALLRDVTDMLSAAGESPAVSLRVEVDPQLPAAVVGDDLRLRQVLINLGGNALKFTERGEVVVGARLLRAGAPPRIEFSVSDTGIGIEPQLQSHIFEGFTQAESSTVRKYGGTGLGLAISQRLVALMGGTLEVDSVLGRGSRFHFAVDFAEADLALLQDGVPDARRRAPPAASALEGVRILLVEDNAVNQQVARELLASRGADVEIAEDGSKALARVVQAPGDFDIVLMDVQMPVMDGYTATREIRRAGAALPVVAMTANAMAGDREACLAAGMDDHVGKPFDIEELVATVHRNLGRAADAAAPAPPGIDLAGALSRLGGDVGFFLQVYESARADADAMLRRLAQLEGGTPDEEAARIFHTLKGLAGTLGATGLARAAAEGEAAMREGGGDRTGVVDIARHAYAHDCARLDIELARMQ